MKPHAFHKQRRPGGQADQRGVSLIEVMYTILLLSILSVGGGAFISYARAESYAQLHRRQALEAAHARLEELSHADYNAIKPATLNYNTYYISGSPASWTVTSSDPAGTVSIAGQSHPMTTTVTYQDIDGGADSYDYLRAQVSVGFRSAAGNTIALEVFLEP